MDWIMANYTLVGAVVCALLLVAVLLFGRRAARERFRGADVLDEGAAPAARNEALIKAPSAAAAVSLGEAVAAVAAVADVVQCDDLARIKGVGPKLKARLAELGVSSFAQIAAWSEADIAAVDAQLGTFAGRCTRDQWVAQAGFLASGDVAGYEAQFGKL
jgi:predicted flap endonuclease-1-like 5' DNA nuclease